MRRPLIAVGIPVWRGGSFVHETLESVLRQTAISFSVFISVDGGDMASVEACLPFLQDQRVRMVVQKSRLGWVRNSAAVLAAAVAQDADYACVQPHDDLMEVDYLTELLAAAEAHPAAAVVYSDLQAFGANQRVISQPSVIGSPLERMTTLLREHFDAVAYRGLTRTSALRSVPPISGNPFDDFAADTLWMTRLARTGNLIRLPRVLYLKRYHDANTHSKWGTWSQPRKIDAWTRHSLDMLAEALSQTSDPVERRTIWATARARLLKAGPCRNMARELSAMTPEARARMLRRFEAAAARRRDIGLSHADLPPRLNTEGITMRRLKRMFAGAALRSFLDE
jgi:GT2 family glycosyltransferase